MLRKKCFQNRKRRRRPNVKTGAFGLTAKKIGKARQSLLTKCPNNGKIYMYDRIGWYTLHRLQPPLFFGDLFFDRIRFAGRTNGKRPLR